MKKYIDRNNRLRTAAGIVSLWMGGVLLLASCVSRQEADPNAKGTGRFTVASLSGDGEYVTFETKAGESVDVSGFHVAVLDQDGESLPGGFEWDSFAEIDGQTITIPSGKYRFTAHNRPKVPTPAAWEYPVYEGTTDFSVKIGALTEVKLVCKLTNIKVTLDFTENFRRMVDQATVEVYTDYTDPDKAEKKKANLIWTPEETRAGYFDVPEDGQIYVCVKGIRKEDGKPLGNGEGQTFKIVKREGGSLQAQDWAKILIGYEQSGTGGLSVSVDPELHEEDHTVIVPDGDDVINGGEDNENWEGDDDPNGGSSGGEDSASAAANAVAGTYTGVLDVELGGDVVGEMSGEPAKLTMTPTGRTITLELIESALPEDLFTTTIRAERVTVVMASDGSYTLSGAGQVGVAGEMVDFTLHASGTPQRMTFTIEVPLVTVVATIENAVRVE